MAGLCYIVHVVQPGANTYGFQYYIDAQDNAHRTPIHVAASCGKEDVVLMLIEDFIMPITTVLPRHKSLLLVHVVGIIRLSF